MGKRRSEEWDKLVSEYYSIEPRITIKAYCKAKKICMNQFHENKRRYLVLDKPLEKIKTSEQSRFRKVEIRASEKETLSFLLKVLSSNVKS